MIKKVLLFLITATLALLAFYTIETKRAGTGNGDVIVEIRRGATLRGVANKLVSEKIISSPMVFEVAARLGGAAKKIHAGEFLLQRSSSINEIIKQLTYGKTILRPVTIPEGLTIREIGRKLENMGFATEESFIAATYDKKLLASFNIPAESMEGYLFPETYHFPKGITAKNIAKTMLKMFFSQVSEVIPEDEIKNRARLHKVITLASLIEKETAVKSERKTISSVFTNRLKKKMLLQCDPTVIYALPEFDGNIRKKDLEYDSPYNTYRYRGLPPGPIANPGLASIDAANYPADTKYIYFVAKNNGEHLFSSTLKEHNRAVAKYQKNRR